jgi:hypothetical protein
MPPGFHSIRNGDSSNSSVTERGLSPVAGTTTMRGLLWQKGEMPAQVVG